MPLRWYLIIWLWSLEKLDSNGYPLFNGEKIFNKKVIIVNSLDENTILFGDFSYLYILIRKPLSVRILTEKYIASCEYGYAGIERLDAKITDVNAIKALVINKEEQMQHRQNLCLI